MTFLQVLIQHIESLWSGATVYFGTAPGPSKPYIVLLIVPPNDETPTVFCYDMGEAGSINLQFSCAADSTQAAYNELESLKDVVQSIRGVIGTSPNQYRVNANRTGGVQTFDASLGTWSAIFESTLTWDTVQ